jgi:hypothetical protein
LVNLSTEDLAAISAMATQSALDALIKSGAIKPPKARRERTNWERLLMFEYIAKFYPTIPHWMRVEIGAVPGQEHNPLYSKTRRWADAILRMPDHMLIIEGKMKSKPDVVSQLLNYKRLLPETPLFTKYCDLPIKMKLVCALIDDDTSAFVKEAGIEVEVFKPSNFEEWYRFTIEKDSSPLPKIR